MNKLKEKQYPQHNQRTLRKIDTACNKLIELGMSTEDAADIISVVKKQPRGLCNFLRGVGFGVELLKSEKLTNPKEVLTVLMKAGYSIKNEINQSLENEPHDPNFGSGSVRELEVAVLRLRQRSTEVQIGTIKIGSRGVYKDVGADVVDRTPQIKEAIQVKRVSSDDPGTFWDNFERSIKQLNGTTGEEIPRGYKKVADIQISNRKNLAYNRSAESFIEIIYTRPTLKALLKDFDGTVFITSGKNQIELNLKRGKVIAHNTSKIHSTNLSVTRQVQSNLDPQVAQSINLLDTLTSAQTLLSDNSSEFQDQRSDRATIEQEEALIDNDLKQNLTQESKALTESEKVALMAKDTIQIDLEPDSPSQDLDEDYGLSM